MDQSWVMGQINSDLAYDICSEFREYEYEINIFIPSKYVDQLHRSEEPYTQLSENWLPF